MKCPYRKNIVHQPDRNEHYIRYFAQDIEEFGNCYENECPFYVDKRCYKAEMETNGRIGSPADSGIAGLIYT